MGPPLAHGREEDAVLPGRLGLQHTHRHLNTGLAKELETLAGDGGVGIFDRRNHASHSGSDHGGSAGRRPPPVVAGFERDVERGAGGAIAGRGQGFHLGMRPSRGGVEPLAYHLAVGHHDGAHHGVG